MNSQKLLLIPMRKILFFLVLPFSSMGQGGVFKIENDASLKDALVSYYIADLDSAAPIAAYQESKNLSPASVLKLFSTAVALSELGPDYQQESGIYISGTVAAGSLNGDLIIDPNYNPTLGAMRFGQNLEKVSTAIQGFLTAKGITNIQGKLQVVEKVSVPQRIPRTWIWEDMGNYYGAGGGSVAWNENILELMFSSGAAGEPAKLLKTEPEVPFLDLVNEVKASTMNRDLAFCYSRPGDHQISISGTIPEQKNYFVVKAAMPDPGLALANLLTTDLLKKGVMIKGKPSVRGQLGAEVTKIGGIKSASVSEIVAQTNLNSVNFYAEALLELAYQHSGAEVEKLDWFKQRLQQNYGIEAPLLFDASGLSRFNAVSSKQVVTLLTQAISGSQGSSFERSLAVAGRTGTLKSLLRRTPANGFVKGKSGSMTGVRCYAGIVTAVSGKNYVFALMLNNYEENYAVLKPLIEQWMLSIFEQ